MMYWRLLIICGTRLVNQVTKTDDNYLENHYFRSVCPTTEVKFFTVCDFAGKAGLSKGYWNQKEKLAVIIFSDSNNA